MRQAHSWSELAVDVWTAKMGSRAPIENVLLGEKLQAAKPSCVLPGIDSFLIGELRK